MIDRHELIEELENFSFAIEINKSMTTEEIIQEVVETFHAYILEIVKSEPTAYDLEAVVKELEAEHELAADTFHGHNGLHELGQLKAYNNAIRIVKRGGRDE